MTDINKILLIFGWLFSTIILTAVAIISGGIPEVIAVAIFGWIIWFIIVYLTGIFRSEKKNAGCVDDALKSNPNYVNGIYYYDYFDFDEFKAYMENRGFQVEWNGVKRYNPHYGNRKVHYDSIYVTIPKSVEELREEGIYRAAQQQIIGKYFPNVETYILRNNKDGFATFEVEVDNISYRKKYDTNDDYIIDVWYNNNEDIYYVLRRNSGLKKKKLNDLTDNERRRKGLKNIVGSDKFLI